MKKIMVIGEDKAAIRKITDLLRESGYGVSALENGSGGILSARDTFSGLIMCNVQLPDKEGRNSIRKRLTEEDHILLKSGSNPEIIKIRNIVYISAAHEYSSIYLSQKKNILVQRQMKEWERLLPDKVFLRIHRSTIINLNYVSKMEKWFNHSFRLYLKEIPQGFVTSRRYSTKLRSVLSL